MKRIASRCVVCGAIALIAFGFSAASFINAQDDAKPAAKSDGDKKTSGDRLPRNYGKIGLTETQRKSVYEVVGKYGKEIDELEKKIAELKAKEVAECEAILTPNQRQSLQDLNAEAKKKAASKKKSSTKDDAGKEGTEKSEKK